MENKNVIFIILIIVVIFFLSGDRQLFAHSYNNNAIPLLLILVIFYLYYNKFSMHLMFICIIIFIIFTTDIKNIIIDRLNYHTDNQFSYRLNELFSNIMNKSNSSVEHLNTSEDQEEEIIESPEGIDDLSYDDFKQEINNFNGDSIEQNINSSEQNRNSSEQNINSPEQNRNTIESNRDESPDIIKELDTDSTFNKNNGRDINSLFNELNSKVDVLKTNPTYRQD